MPAVRRAAALAVMMACLAGLPPQAYALQALPTSLPTTTTSIMYINSDYTGTIPTQYGLLTLVTSLELRANSLTGTFPTQLGLMSGLADNLALGGNTLSQSLPTELGMMSALSQLFRLYSNDFTGVLPTEIGRLTSFTSSFFLYETQVSGQLPSQIGHLTGLEESFSIYGNLLTGSIPSQVGNFEQFTSGLFLYSNSLDKPLASEIGRLGELKTDFVLSFNSITGLVPSEFGSLTKIVEGFLLYTNALSGLLPSELGRMSKLSHGFRINGNQLTSSLPSELGQLVLLESMFRVSSNKLTSTLPSELGQFVVFQNSFEVHDCEFSGPIPTELGGMTSLTRNFYLDSNELCSDVPSQLAALSDQNRLNTWDVTTDNDLGTLCCVASPGAFTCDPTAAPTAAPSTVAPTPGPSVGPTRTTELPTPLPTPPPTGLPTPSPTPFCGRGEEFNGESCEVCGYGHYRNDTDLPAVCMLCPAGTYRFYSPNPSDATECLECSAGRLSSADRRSCEACSAGQYVMNDTSCESCEPGRYAPTAQDGACLECAAGSYTGAILEATECESCDAGLYSAAESVNCTTCPAGTFSTTRSEACTDCDAGKFSSSPGSDSCSSCDSGTYSQAGASACSDCPMGEYSTTGEESCLPCLAGYYTAIAGSSSCYACAAGRFSPSLGSTNCTACGVGTYQSASGQSSCVECDQGTYTDQEASSSCTACAAGTHQNATGATACEDCALGTHQSVTGQCDCLACDAGFYACTTGSSSCTACAAGFYADQTGSTNCTTCPSGTFQASTGQSACTNCEAGFFTRDAGASGCLKCSSEYGQGYTSHRGDDCCDLCEAGYYLNNDHECIACPSGFRCDDSGQTLAHLVVAAGHFRFTPTSTKVYACEYPNNCKMTNSTVNDKQCVTGSSGPLCSSCDVGYYLDSFSLQCEKCSMSVATFFLPLLIGGLLFVLGALSFVYRDRIAEALPGLYATYEERIQDAMELLTIFVVTMQVIVLLRQSHTNLGGTNVQSPYAGFVDAFEFLSLDIVQGVSTTCFVDVGQSFYVLVWTMLPIVVYWIGSILLVKAEAEERARHLAVFVMVLFLVLPTMSMCICYTFRCTTYDGGDYRYLSADHDVDCTSAEYRLMVIYASVACLVYPVGVPLGLFIWLSKYRHVLDPPHTAEEMAIQQRKVNPELATCAVAYFAMRHKPRYWYFEVYNMLRRLLLTSVTLVFTSTDNLLLFTLLVAVVTTVIEREAQAQLNPFVAAFVYVCNWQVVLVIIGMIAADSGMTDGHNRALITGLVLLGMNVFIMLVVCIDTHTEVLRKRFESDFTSHVFSGSLVVRDSRASSLRCDKPLADTQEPSSTEMVDVSPRITELVDFTGQHNMAWSSDTLNPLQPSIHTSGQYVGESKHAGGVVARIPPPRDAALERLAF